MDDLSKYKPFKPYAASQAETANLLYAAVLLRTTDLLQITRQRAPSVMFRMIDPKDPISQTEWIKQNAVRGIFPKPVTDKDGHVKAGLQSDTLSVYAKYHNENGFFGLTAYLAYASKQLAYAYSCAQKAKSQTTNKLDFPWRTIDDSQVEAVGFIPNPFEFQIDQTKILDLLTGHTLYNDSSVAIRELVQNSIDAVRLQCFLKGIDSRTHGKIKVSWNSELRALTIVDNGTGMTQDIIERHLLNVGSSRYQDSKFKEKHPDFSPISRFGIGVLSTFMVADNVQIVTFHEDQEEGREITLRSVHGKYLIRLLDKKTSSEALEIGAHGTKIILRMRASSKRVNVLHTLKQWILFPRCEITASIDTAPAEAIGYSSPKESLEAFLRDAQLGLDRERIQVEERTFGDTTLAFVTVYNQHFRDRQFLQYSDSMQHSDKLAPMGICIEGIRVEFGSPGFYGNRAGLLSIVNCTGRSAPKTNVARTALESEADKTRLNTEVFEAYLEQVQDEITRLQKVEGFSLSYAVDQFPWIAGSLYSSNSLVQIAASMNKFPMFMVEDEQGRRAMSISELSDSGGFWTVESTSMNSLIRLLKDTPASITCKNVAAFSRFKGAALPAGNLVTNSPLSTMPKALLEAGFEISELRASIDDRRLDAQWLPRDQANPRWLNAEEIEQSAAVELRDELRMYRRLREERRAHGGRFGNIQIALRACDQVGLDAYFGVVALNTPRILAGTPIADYLTSLDCEENPKNTLPFLIFLDALVSCFGRRRSSPAGMKAQIEYSLQDATNRLEHKSSVDSVGFLKAISETEDRLAVFNPWSWERIESGAYNEGIFDDF
ncbi:MAG TPA: ATP-binding protein [Bradyrhizobium sp.]|nr:ATP-binding protein [Bradyrhizobium sp.]